MSEPPAPAYGTGRTRTNVSYGDVERAAILILKSERRPTVETVREVLGRGSNDTIGEALRRFWRDLGARAEGDPAALARLPVEIAELTEGIWQRALKLAGDAATHEDNAARERLAQLQLENEIRLRSFDLREREIDTQARERERALADARDHLLSLSKALSREQVTNQTHERRVAALEAEVAQYRQQIAGLIASAIAQNRTRLKPPVARRREPPTPRRVPSPRSPEPARTPKSRSSKPKAAPRTARRAPQKPGRTSSRRSTR